MKWYREPLLHFLLIGTVLFVLYSAFNNDRDSSPNRIKITEDGIQRLTLIWQVQWNRPPTASELDHLIESEIRQEVLYREALSMGLDRDDEIIKRRPAQKMEFLADDLTTLREPSPEELKAHFEKNRGQFKQSPLTSFRHIYFSPDKRAEDVRQDAGKALSLLKAKSNDDVEKYNNLGDPIMLQYQYDNQTPHDVGSSFGSKFTEELFKLPTQSWQGPIESGYGFHLVWIESRTKPHTPPLEEVKKEVIQAWQSEQREKAKQEFFEKLKTRYEIIVDVANATWTNTIGATELITVWKDPDFNPAHRAFYYVRVIEIPTPRWTAYDAKYFDLKNLDPKIPMTTQERAYTSPIWYTPGK